MEREFIKISQDSNHSKRHWLKEVEKRNNRLLKFYDEMQVTFYSFFLLFKIEL